MIHPSKLSGPIVVAGHACLDITPAFPPHATIPGPGKLTAVGMASISTGGAVPNVGLALHKLGAPVRMVALVADDLFGAGLRGQLDSSGADLRLHVRMGKPTSYSIVLTPDGVDRSFVHCPGVNDEFNPDEDVTDDDLSAAIALHFGYPPLMRRTYIDEGESLSRLFGRCRSLGLMTSLDLCSPDPAVITAIDWATWFSRVLPNVAIFSPCVDELRSLLRLDVRDNLDDVPNLARRMLDYGAGVVCIKLGSRGLYLRQGSDEIWQPSLPARYVNANGAGDCTIAGLLTATLCGYSTAQAARLACAVGAFSVENVTATGGIKSWDHVLQRSW
jgi:sugar/nucleoside kinase (ribokinase family)